MEIKSIAEEWEDSKKNFLITELMNGKNLQETITTLRGFKEAFSHELNTIACADERVVLSPDDLINGVEAEIKIGIAGQLILASDDEINKFAAKWKNIIKRVTSHDFCGAAKIAFEKLEAEGKIPEGITTPDELGKHHSEKLAKRLNADYRHISNPNSLHDARAICFDGTGKFNPAAIPDMPSHYICSGHGFGLSNEYCKSELKTLSRIAMSDHGFGKDRFSFDNPFFIFISAESEEEMERLIKIAEEAVFDFGDKVKVDGFVRKTEK